VIVTFTGIRDLASSSEQHVRAAVEAVMAEGATELRFGGALGADTVALTAADDLDVVAHLVVFVPGRVADQPAVARDAIQAFADEVVELRLPLQHGRLPAWAFLRRNDAMLTGRVRPNLQLAKAQLCVGFKDGREHGGTHYTLQKAAELGILNRTVPVVGLGISTK
jgi:hypothetical protein